VFQKEIYKTEFRRGLTLGFRRGGNLSKTQEELRKNRMDSKLKFWLAQIDLSEQEKDVTKQTCIRYIDIVMKKTEA
jgi:hypothetical protein